MGIHSKIDAFQAGATRDVAADMLARVIADHAAQRLAQRQAVHRAIVGQELGYTISVNGASVSGFGSVLAATALARIRTAVGGGASRGQFDVLLLIQFALTAVHVARLLTRIRGRRTRQDDPLAWIARTLIERSPFRSGTYRDGHALFGDGIAIADARAVAGGAALREAAEYAFTNPVSYSRKIEMAVTKSGRPFVIQVEPRIYERTARDARALFGDIASIEYSLRGIVGGNQINQGKAHSYRPARAASGRIERRIAPGAHNKPGVRYPTIVVRFR